MATIVEFKDYSMGFKDDDGKVFNLLDRLCLRVEAGKALGVVGESGCGKSMTSLSAMRLLPDAATVQGGEILLEGEDLLQMSEEEMRRVRGNKLAMIFQEPMTALNPVLTIGQQIGEVLTLHHPEMNAQEVRERVIQSLAEVGIAAPETRVDQYPHEFSGGMRQRVMIAMAIINHPDLLIADEPTTALDVTIQAQILKLMDKLVKEQDAALILITHDLAVVSQMADRIIVMYCGKIVESGSRDDVIHRPSHPYTVGLLNSIPRMGEDQDRLESIPGMVPSMLDLPQGCYFAPRCKYCQDICRTRAPENHEVGPGHCAACHFPLTGGGSHE